MKLKRMDSIRLMYPYRMCAVVNRSIWLGLWGGSVYLGAISAVDRSIWADTSLY